MLRPLFHARRSRSPGVQLTLPAILPFLLAVCTLAALPRPALADDSGGGHDPGTARVLVGDAHTYHPLVNTVLWRDIRVTAPLSTRARVEATSAFPMDAKGTELSRDPGGDFQVRVGLTLNTGTTLAPVNVGVVYEHDVITGPVGGTSDAAVDMHPIHGIQQQVRKAYLRVSLGRMLHLMGGLMTSQWGLGLVANDGSHTWRPGSAAFVDPRGGDRVLRLMFATGALTPLGISLALGFDWVQSDDAMLQGDAAREFVGAATVGQGRSTTLGFYGVFRHQTSDRGALTEVGVLDMTLRTVHTLPAGLRLRVEAESVLIIGESGLAPTNTFARHDLLQVGAALRASLSGRRLGGVFDLLYASGDADLSDLQATGFKTDPNYEMGLLMFRQVLAAHTGRAPTTAADRNLSGYPALDLDRYPTRESATNVVAFFPRVWWRPLRGLEVYGGPLVAFTPVPLTDPLNSRLAGGMSRNALGGRPGSYLGTEIDLGARFQMMLAGTELTLGAEGGVLLPGSALNNAGGAAMDPVFGGRGLLAYRF